MGTPTEANLLDTPIFSIEPLSLSLQQVLLLRIWPIAPNRQHTPKNPDDRQLQIYLAQMQRECSPAVASHHAAQSFFDLLVVLDTIRACPTANLAEIQQELATSQTQPRFASCTATQISTSMELAVRLWLMVSVRITMPAQRRLLEFSLPWPYNLSLMDVLQRHLTLPPATQTPAAGRFSEYLNIVEMRRIANIRVLWTNNLGEHLTMQGPILYLFQHVAALKQLKASDASNLFISPEFIEETIATLNLLIPHDNPACNSWIREEIDRYELDPELVYRATASRNKGDFVFWQERLSNLSDHFDRTKPSSLIQWWHDRRDMGQWWNYWLVVVGISLTVIFGLIQSVTGIIQVSHGS